MDRIQALLRVHRGRTMESSGQVLVQSVEGRMMRRCDPKIVFLWVNSEHDHEFDNLIFTTEISKDRPPLWRFG